MRIADRKFAALRVCKSRTKLQNLIFIFVIKKHCFLMTFTLIQQSNIFQNIKSIFETPKKKITLIGIYDNNIYYIIIICTVQSKCRWCVFSPTISSNSDGRTPRVPDHNNILVGAKTK